MDVRPHEAQPAPVMEILRDHLPLTLLVDLAMGEDLHSDEVFTREVADLAWLVPPPR